MGTWRRRRKAGRLQQRPRRIGARSADGPSVSRVGAGLVLGVSAWQPFNALLWGLEERRAGLRERSEHEWRRRRVLVLEA